MWDFIKYCLRCFIKSMASAAGSNSHNMTIKDEIVGMATMIVLVSLLVLLSLLLLSIIVKIINCFRKKRDNQK